MDYSYVPQMYQQGVTHNLDKQFQLAGQAQPVAQFLASLRQAKQMELQQQMEEDRQRRMDIEQQRADQMAKYQNANSEMAFMSHTSQELTPGNAPVYRDISMKTFGRDLVPQPTVIPGKSYAAGEVHGGIEEVRDADGKVIMGGVAPSGPMSFSDFIKQPTGSRMQLQQDQLATRERMAKEKEAARSQVEGDKIRIKQDAQKWRMDSANPDNRRKAELADKYHQEMQRLSDLLEAGEPAARVALLRAQTAKDYASAQDHLSSATMRGQYTPGMAGHDAAAADRAEFAGAVRLSTDPISRNATVTPIPRRSPTVGGAAPAAGPAPNKPVVTQPLPEDKKQRLFALQAKSPQQGQQLATELWNSGFRW